MWSRAISRTIVRADSINSAAAGGWRSTRSLVAGWVSPAGLLAAEGNGAGRVRRSRELTAFGRWPDAPRSTARSGSIDNPFGGAEAHFTHCTTKGRATGGTDFRGGPSRPNASKWRTSATNREAASRLSSAMRNWCAARHGRAAQSEDIALPDAEPDVRPLPAQVRPATGDDVAIGGVENVSAVDAFDQLQQPRRTGFR